MKQSARKAALRALWRSSIWSATAKMPSRSTLSENLQADVCIVGAGIAGLTTGYLLTKAGRAS